MDSLFQVIAHEDANDQSKIRQAGALSARRVEDRFGNFLRQSNREDAKARYDLVKDDIKAVIAAACEEVGAGDPVAIERSLIAVNKGRFEYNPREREGMDSRTASRHEARKPKLCPYHSEVVDISLAQGEPQAGFNAMAQHAWSGKHCQGEEYEGHKCNFKREMTTQSFWDEKAEKAEERKQEREEAAQREQDAQATELEVHDLNEVSDLPEADTSDVSIGDEISPEPVATSDEPMLMAASRILGYSGPANMPAAQNPEADFIQQAQRLVQYYQSIGNELEAQKYQRILQMAQQGSQGVQRAASMIKNADDGLGGKGAPEPKIDKRKWTPSNPGKPEDTDSDSRNPTKRKDIVEPIKAENADKLEEIGENKTEHQDVTKKVDNIKGKGGVFPSGGQAKPVSSAFYSPEYLANLLG